MEATYVVELTFATDQGGELTVAVPNADPSVTGGEARAAMERVIAARAVMGAKGRAAGIKKAALVATEAREIDLG